LIALGYRRVHRSADADNHRRSDERVDFIFARRPAAAGRDPFDALNDPMTVIEVCWSVGPTRDTLSSDGR